VPTHEISVWSKLTKLFTIYQRRTQTFLIDRY
jgi:hypothetical protein